MEVFDRLYQEYDEWYRVNEAIFRSELKVLEEFKLMGRGLDIGVGTGVFASRLGVPYGVDPAVNPLRLSKERGVEVVASVGESLPFRDNVFDYVLMTISICFFKRPLDVLRESARVIRKDGRLVVCFVPRDSQWGKFYESLGRKGHRFYRYARFYTLREIAELLNEAGYRIREIKATLSYPPRSRYIIDDVYDEPRGKGFLCISASLR